MLTLVIGLVVAMSAEAEDKVWVGRRSVTPPTEGQNDVVHRCLTPSIGDVNSSTSTRKAQWSLPEQALSTSFDTIIRVLVLRFDFQYEEQDDPNSTGRGRMDLSRPLANAVDSARYFDTIGHWIDPPPHDSAYFSSHMRALNLYWLQVSQGRYHLVWDIFPKRNDSLYTLPHPMSYYGRCPFDSVVVGLEEFFKDCIHGADSSPEIDFSRYQAIVIFHAGSDRQNDIGFPQTCADLFTGFIKFKDSIPVDDGRTYIRKAVMMPETACQDNRATALNAVLAHEFGHQLGLVDLYNTRGFMSQLGDFCLMDNNGFGSGIEYEGFTVGKVFGAIPVYPDAWSRAYLGFDSVADFRHGSDIRLVAAEIASRGLKIARVPISENEYYLIENRNIDTDGDTTVTRVDSTTNVILGPANKRRQFTGEYDFLMPGSGMLIYRVDEGVAGLDYNDNGTNNFEDNTLQWDPNRRFVSLVEADGFVNFGGYYRKGYGDVGDCFRDDLVTRFTPNTNPPALDNGGNNTHVSVTGITRELYTSPGNSKPILLDSVMFFDVETDMLAAGFPVRAGYPVYPLSSIVDDLDRDGQPEVIAAARRLITVFTTAGENYLRKRTNCTTCPEYADIVKSTMSAGTPRVVPAFAIVGGANDTITSGPVTGDFAEKGLLKFVAVGYRTGPAAGRVVLYVPTDDNRDGLADLATEEFATDGKPVALSFGNILYVLTDKGKVYRRDGILGATVLLATIDAPLFQGISRIGNRLVVMAGSEQNSKLFVVGSTLDSISLGDNFSLGPITADMNRDSIPEVVSFTTDGDGICVSVDTTREPPLLTVLAQSASGYHLTVNPIVGDVDDDGLPDAIVGGTNALYAFDGKLVLKSNFPLSVDDRFPSSDIIASPVSADISRGGRSELIFPNDAGAIHSYGTSSADLPAAVQVYSRTAGFPLSAGEKGAGSCVVFADSAGGKLGYLGADGWFYAWEIDRDSSADYWPMGGHDPSGSFTFPADKLHERSEYPQDYLGGRFYNYPNPVTTGSTNFRYFLGEEARRVTVTVYDLSGQRMASFDGTRAAGENSQTWNCSDLTPGVYRCRLEATFSGTTKSVFTDVAIIR